VIGFSSLSFTAPGERFARTPALPVAPVSVTQNSLALDFLCQHLRPEKKYNILDLGSAWPENIDFYSKYTSKLYVEDLYEALSDQSSPELQNGAMDVGSAAYSDLLTYQGDTTFNIIFAWDLFNYLSRERLYAFMQELSKRCSRKAFIFAFISTRSQITQRPLAYKILDQKNILCGTTDSKEERLHPRYREAELLKIMPGFKVFKSFLLRNGMQEYLFTCG
jgi:cyclopropane fatty-acyl-phospholipid synthase-like methyltransferase